MAGLKRSEELSRTLKIHLNGKLKMDSNGHDYNLCGNVILRDFVKHIEHVRLTDTHVLTLSSDTHVKSEVIVAQNSGEKCIELFKTPPTEKGYSYESILLPTKHVKKIELMESTKVTLTP